MSSPEPRPRRRRAAGIALGVLYWAVVLAISLALVVAFIMFLESRDPSSIDPDGRAPAGAIGPALG